MIPLDKEGKPLAWRYPSDRNCWVDAWNGIYDSLSFLLDEVPHWTAREEDRILQHGEDIVDEVEVLRRLALTP